MVSFLVSASWDGKKMPQLTHSKMSNWVIELIRICLLTVKKNAIKQENRKDTLIHFFQSSEMHCGRKAMQNNEVPEPECYFVGLECNSLRP